MLFGSWHEGTRGSQPLGSKGPGSQSCPPLTVTAFAQDSLSQSSPNHRYSVNLLTFPVSRKHLGLFQKASEKHLQPLRELLRRGGLTVTNRFWNIATLARGHWALRDLSRGHVLPASILGYEGSQCILQTSCFGVCKGLSFRALARSIWGGPARLFWSSHLGPSGCSSGYLVPIALAQLGMLGPGVAQLLST